MLGIIPVPGIAGAAGITIQKVCRLSENSSELWHYTPHDVLLIVQIPPMVTVDRFAQPDRALRSEGLQAPYSPGETTRSMIGATKRKPKE